MAIARFFNVMREATGTKEAKIPDSCQTVGQALGHLTAAFPGLGGKLLDEKTGLLKDGVVVLLDGRKVSKQAMATKVLPRGGELSFFEIVGGG